ncbi:DNA polymerase [Clostridium ljungdahlii]|uniref:DNA polymerase I n=1 Tax=Clostridium ljungdahlii TaxID=1538 RepID=A0A162LAA3_9CLOT|nr:DNA polymerase I [Clostridium ljungdahlii]
MKKEKIIGLDTETTGLDYDKDHIVGISMTLPKADYHCYIPVGHVTGEKQLSPEYVFSSLNKYLENEKLGKVLHNAKFDFHMFYKEGIYVKGLIMDTIIAMKILNENELTYALKNLATKYGKYFGFEDKSMTYEELFGKGGFERTPFDIATVYACKDTHLCYRFYKWIDTQFDRLPKIKKIYYEIENPLLIVSFDMEKNGFEMNLDFAQKYKRNLTVEIIQLEKKLYKIFGEINLNSPTQLGKVIYDQMKLPDISKTRSVDAETIKKLADHSSDIKALLDYRNKKKLLGTYIEPLPQKIWKRDNRLHGNFNQNGTKTGRYSSNDPNLQNIPPEARPMFVAPKGKVIIGKDLSQIEPRCLAYMSGDEHFQHPYLHGGDLYSSLASKTLKLDMKYCLDGAYDPTHTFKPRKRMKTGLLAVMYGTSIFTLSQQLGITLEEAKQFIEDFLNTYPTARDYIQSIKDFVDENEYVETYLGRKRRFIGHKKVAQQYKAVCKHIIDVLGYMPTNIWQEKKLSRHIKNTYWKYAKDYGRVTRQAVNAVIQGSSADYIKIVMLRVNNYLKILGEEYKLLGIIHDEILMEVPDIVAPEVIAELDRIMTSIEWFKFPIKTDTVIMYQWGNEINVSKWLEDRENYNKKRSA